MQIAEKKPLTIEWSFLGLFVLYICILVGMAEMEHGSMLALREFTASAISSLWGLFSVPVICSATQIDFVGFPMEIVLECTALHYMIIFIAGVLAFRSHTLSYRAAGIIIGTLAIFFLNIVRVGIIGFIGRYYSGIFDFVHNYIWQGMFALCVVMLWVIWINGKQVFSRRAIKQFLIMTVSASLSFLFVVTFLETYIALIATISNVMFPVISVFIDVPQKVIAEGKLIGYVIGDKVIYSETPLYFLNATLLIPIASLTIVPSQMKAFLKRLSVAAILLVGQHLLIITLDWILEVTAGPVIHSIIIWCIVMSTFVAPMLLWLLVMKIFQTESLNSRQASLP